MFPYQAASQLAPDDETPSSGDIAKLVESHRGYAHAIAAEVARKVPQEVESKDIRAAAELGLVEAANSFDPKRGVQFKTFAYHRIKGAIYDSLRSNGWFSKAQYGQMRFEVAATEYLQDVTAGAQKPASPDAQLQYLKGLTANVLSCYMLSLEAMPQEPEDQRHASAEEQAIVEEQRRRLRTSLAQLPETNRRILEYCYFQDMTLEEVGRKLGLSKSWVCRLHAKSLEMVRKMLAQSPRKVPDRARATFPSTIR